MNSICIKPFIAALILLGCISNTTAQFKKLVWADEFNYSGLPDRSKWGYDTGGHGWGNNELEYYTENRLENARVENGFLVLTAIKESFKGMDYSSSRLVSKNKGDWKYGKIEVRAKLPHGKGTWPAIWMLPTDWKYGGWPKSGEIDIMEFVGYMPDSVFGSVHTGAFNHMIGTQSTKGVWLGDLVDAFHVYAIEWTKDKISFFIDGKKYHEFLNNGTGSEAWPFDQPFHVILNLAVGGNWGGKMGVDASVFPQRMLVDYVRVYQ
ncbi:glycoside hydrolase family 16 protein [Flavihumibacter fluvii]|uniref:glycoside hydrolase family 16 protein n=1 Tax=Flavihumibacter fluvii TaxID=2838157 RepID=UPI001BDF3F37|nr:glycoside hydrolase family 16 protein [Flavihumibacter fluvii]ULQ51633.1 glycoside hydrolase family 16 protein [Flavihumibacter fluvii]